MDDQRLSEHFTLREFVGHGGEPVPPRSIPRLRALCRHWLEPLRDRFGPVTVISGYRTQRRNRAVGGALHSRHVYGENGPGVAADVIAERGTPEDWFRYLDKLGAPGLGKYPGHLHVDNRPGRARW